MLLTPALQTNVAALAVGYLKLESPTKLQYARNFAVFVHESIKRVSHWAAHYYTQPSSYYPVPLTKARFTEGFDTVDLKEAKTLLEKLS